MKKILIISLLITLFSCENKFPDYIKKNDNVYMKLLSFEESNKEVEQTSLGVVSIEVFDNGKIIYKRYKEDLMNLESNEFSFLLKHLNLGDSCIFMVSPKSIQKAFKPIKFTETLSKFLEVRVKFHDYSSKKGYDQEMIEQLVLKKYLLENDVNFRSGIYHKQIAKGKGKKIEKGDEITVAYKGYFVNGLEFDNISGRTAFTFSYGSQGQVIKGLEIAINSMMEGEKSKIIIPSQLAFGEVGSTTLIVPPFTTVIYDLEIIKIK